MITALCFLIITASLISNTCIAMEEVCKQLEAKLDTSQTAAIQKMVAQEIIDKLPNRTRQELGLHEIEREHFIHYSPVDDTDQETVVVAARSYKEHRMQTPMTILVAKAHHEALGQIITNEKEKDPEFNIDYATPVYLKKADNELELQGFQTPLILAVELALPDKVVLLLSAGASLTYKNEKQLPALTVYPSYFPLPSTYYRLCAQQLAESLHKDACKEYLKTHIEPPKLLTFQTILELFNQHVIGKGQEPLYPESVITGLATVRKKIETEKRSNEEAEKHTTAIATAFATWCFLS